MGACAARRASIYQSNTAGRMRLLQQSANRCRTGTPHRSLLTTGQQNHKKKEGGEEGAPGAQAQARFSEKRHRCLLELRAAPERVWQVLLYENSHAPGTENT